MKALFSKLLMVSFGFLFAAIIIEVLARQYHLVPAALPDHYYDVRAEVGAYPEPYSYFWFNREDGERIWVQFNNASRRDIDQAYAKSSDTTRIMFLGDSYTAGWQVPLAETYTTQLRSLLSAASDFEVINAGYHGWGTDRQYLYYRTDGYRYDSEIVILQIYVGNDVIDNGIAGFEPFTLDDGRNVLLYDLPPIRPYFILDENNTLAFTPPRAVIRSRKEGIGGIRSFLRYYSFTYTLLERISSIFSQSDDTSDNFPLDEIPIDLYAYSEESQAREDWINAWAITEALIQTLRDEVEANGGELRVLLIDTRWQHDPNRVDEIFATWDLPSDWTGEQLGQQMRDLLERNAIPYLAPLPELLNYADETGEAIVLPQDGHFTAAGHCVVAVEIHNWLVEEEILPSDTRPQSAINQCHDDG